MDGRIYTGTPMADHVMKLLDAAKITEAVHQACKLQLFHEVNKSLGSATTASQLAKNKSWEPDALRRLMDAMVSVELLSKTQQYNNEDTYQNTEGGKLLIKDGHPTMHEYALEVCNQVTFLRQCADKVKKEGGETKTLNVSGSYPPEFWLRIYKMMNCVAQPYADHIVTAIDLRKHKKAVDLGGGSGVFSYALLRAYPEMQVILGDQPTTIPVIEEHFISKNRDPRLSTLALDYLTDTLPNADLYMLVNVVHQHYPDECTKGLLTNVHKALNTGGAILIVDQLLNDGRDGPAVAHAWDLVFLGRSQLFTGNEMASILNECNFGDVQIVKTQDNCIYDIVYACKK